MPLWEAFGYYLHRAARSCSKGTNTMSDKQYDFAVFIGRFQPLHLGHETIIRKAFEIADTPLIFVGSSTASRSIRNPFSYEERFYMIQNACNSIMKEMNLNIAHSTPPGIRAISDSAYNFHDWLIRIKSYIQKLTEVGAEKARIAILGHYRDDSSYYLNYFPEYDFVPVDTQCDDISATQIRDQLLSGNGTGLARRYCSASVFQAILKWMQTGESDDMHSEYLFIQNYKKMWEAAPYPPTFVTTDAVVICRGHVLVIRRGRHPGKDLLALPGGFLNQNETIQNGCIRELKEETKIATTKGWLETSIKDSHVFDHPLRDPRGRTVTHAFLFDLDVKELPRSESVV